MMGISATVPALLGGRFQPERLLREGFVSATWLARDLDSGELVAAKVLHGDMRREAVVRTWFAEQASALSRLDHPHVVRLVYDGSEDEPPYFATEYLPGGSLDEVLASGRHLGARTAIRMGLDVLAALQHAHDRGILHGSIKPGNILFDAEGRACLTDFGPGREQLRHVTMVGVTAGASLFLAPEQGAIPVPTDAGTDLYALGALLVHVITRAWPIALLGPDREAELARLPEPLRPVLDKATQPDLEARYRSADEMAAALRPVLGALKG